LEERESFLRRRLAQNDQMVCMIGIQCTLEFVYCALLMDFLVCLLCSNLSRSLFFIGSPTAI
jgi:hypothetical protein